VTVPKTSALRPLASVRLVLMTMNYNIKRINKEHRGREMSGSNLIRAGWCAIFENELRRDPDFVGQIGDGLLV
jgi:hypothetical protein